jgi:prepilin-type N-terminal cleavage/methylation domain-containing protein/prepilin-type processing-associated H-X9-DG protein
MSNIMKSRSGLTASPRPRRVLQAPMRDRGAFTLIELLVVIAVISLLAMLMFPSLGNVFGMARTTQCSSRLKEIGKAVRLSEDREGPELAALIWQSVLSEYLGGDRSAMVCPEYVHLAGEEDVEEDPPVPLEELAAFQVNERWYDDLGEGPFVAKLSDANWNRARADGWLVESGNNFPKGNYQDGSESTANPYWLCLEDHGNDWDQKDVMVRVTLTASGYLLEAMSGSTGHRNWIVDKPDHNELLRIPSRSALHSLEAITIATTGVVASYGMNVAVPKILGSRPGAVLVMDYHWLIASPQDTWSDYPSVENSSIPTFARHKERINVLFVDGSVKMMDPYDINPRTTTIEEAYWLP